MFLNDNLYFAAILILCSILTVNLNLNNLNTLAEMTYSRTLFAWAKNDLYPQAHLPAEGAIVPDSRGWNSAVPDFTLGI
jgi:hypothetical protein